jgi:hypothetical protein
MEFFNTVNDPLLTNADLGEGGTYNKNECDLL